MTQRRHFHAYLDGVRREGRYRIFTDLERHAARPPYACWRDGSNSREVVVWCTNDYLEWDVIRLLSTPWSRPRAAWAPVPKALGTSQATAMLSLHSRQSLPTFIGRKLRSR